VNGPSVARIARTLLRGFLALKDHPDPRVRARIACETKGLATAYAGALWASEKWFARANPGLAARLRETRLGIDNIYAVYGTGVDTPLAYRVLVRDNPGWRFGKPLPFLTTNGPGDSLILEESASLDGLLALPTANKGRLDEATYGAQGPVTHTPLVYHPYTQQGLIPLYLTGASLPFHTPWEKPDVCAAGRKLVRSTLGPRWQEITEFVLGRVVPDIDPTGYCPQ
jgi:hypothetical protein